MHFSKMIFWIKTIYGQHCLFQVEIKKKCCSKDSSVFPHIRPADIFFRAFHSKVTVHKCVVWVLLERGSYMRKYCKSFIPQIEPHATSWQYPLIYYLVNCKVSILRSLQIFNEIAHNYNFTIHKYRLDCQKYIQSSQSINLSKSNLTKPA